MNNLFHLRLVTPSSPNSPHGSRPPAGGSQTPRAPWEPGRSVSGDEQDIEAMLSDPVSDLVRDMDRLISRRGPLPLDLAVQATLRVAQAVIHDHEFRRYAATTTHVLWLGSILYFALTGAAPLAPRGVTGSPARPPPLASVSSFPITSEVERIVAICLSPDRRDRFPTVKSLEGALAALPEVKVSPSPHVVAEPTADEDDIGADSDRPTVPPTSGVTLSRTANVEMPAPRRAGRTST